MEKGSIDIPQTRLKRGDIVLAGELTEADFLLTPDHPDFPQSGLKKASADDLKPLLGYR